MLKIVSWIADRVNFIITKSPPEQYSSSKIKIKETGDETKLLNEYKNATTVFDDILGATNSRYVDQFFIRGGHNNLYFYYLSHTYFVLLKRTMRNISNKINRFDETLKDIENIYRNLGGYDLSYDEVEQ